MAIAAPNYQTTENFVPSAARTTSGTSTASAVYVGNANAVDLVVWINVTAVSGTAPTLDLRMQWSSDGSTWYDGDADTIAQKTAASAFCKRFPIKGRQARLAWTLGGTTPSFTFNADLGYIPA